MKVIASSNYVPLFGAEISCRFFWYHAGEPVPVRRSGHALPEANIHAAASMIDLPKLRFLEAIAERVRRFNCEPTATLKQMAENCAASQAGGPRLVCLINQIKRLAMTHCYASYSVLNSDSAS